jgi:hypothetical protein
VASERIGTCHVCRREGVKLTFEHVPPKSSFNEGRTEVYGLMEFLNRPGNEEMTGGTVEQRGAGEWTLCESCNNKTGSWYVPELGKATAAAAKLLRAMPLDEIDENPEEVVARITFRGAKREPRPLLLIKQIVTMLLAVSPLDLSLKNPELGDFVLDRKRSGLAERFQLYLALFAGPIARTVGYAARFDVYTGRHDLISEIAFPPLAYSMTIDSPEGALRVGNITGFADCGYDQETPFEIDMIVGFGHYPMPLDYRSNAAVERDRQRNEEEGRRLRGST